MRLTTITRMSLPAGVVHLCATDITTGQECTPPSFDQARHASLGRRAGSWMAVSFRLPFPADRDHVLRAWSAVIARHGTLRTVIEGGDGHPGSGTGEDAGRNGDDDGLRLRHVTVRPVGWQTPQAEPGEDPRAVLRRVFDEACCPFATPAHALCLVEPDDPADPRDEPEAPVVVIGLDHSHVDAWSLLVLMRDFCSCLGDLACGLEPGTCLPSAAAFAEHTRELAARPPAPPEVHRKWAAVLARGGGEMPVFPLDLGDVSTPREEVVEVRDVLDADGVAALEEASAAEGVRMIAVAMAEMTAVFQRRAGVGLRAVLPVHSRHHERWHDSVGWFITNSVIECAEADPGACAVAVREAVELGSHALGPILDTHGGMPHTPGMFAISWLDHRRLPIDVDQSLGPQHVSASIRTTGVMVWFVINGSGLHVRCRYPDTARARASVGGWLDELCAGLAQRALNQAGPRDPARDRPAATPRPTSVRA